MKWKGTVVPAGTRIVATTLIAIQANHKSSTQDLLSRDGIPDITNRFDCVRAELGSQAGDAHVDDVRTGIERHAPYVGQDRLASADLAGVTQEITQKERLALGHR